MSSSLKYIKVHGFESFGSDYAFGVQILVSIDRPLTESDNEACRIAANQIHKELMKETIRVDPKRALERKQERAELISIFPGPIFVEEIPNGYCPDYCCAFKPWFMVTTKVGRIKIGWRKRVINIDWSHSTVIKLADELFPQEVTTKTGRAIHAWGIDKAREYVNVILGAT